VWLWVLWLLGLFGAACVVWGGCSAWWALHPPRTVPEAREPAPGGMVIPFVDERGETFDVWYQPVATPRARVVLLHGYYANRDQIIGVADGLTQRDFEVVLLELRGHGDRQGPFTFGVSESDDAGRALQWVTNRPPKGLPSAILGLSAGGAVACRVALRYPEIKAVITDSTYATLFPVLAREIHTRYRLPAVPWAWVTWAAIHAFLRQPPGTLDPAMLGRSVRRPLLVIQGGMDARVSLEDSDVLARGWGGVAERWVEPNVPHVGMFTMHPEEYCDRIDAFLTQAIRIS